MFIEAKVLKGDGSVEKQLIQVSTIQSIAPHPVQGNADRCVIFFHEPTKENGSKNGIALDHDYDSVYGAISELTKVIPVLDSPEQTHG